MTFPKYCSGFHLPLQTHSDYIASTERLCNNFLLHFLNTFCCLWPFFMCLMHNVKSTVKSCLLFLLSITSSDCSLAPQSLQDSCPMTQGTSLKCLVSLLHLCMHIVSLLNRFQNDRHQLIYILCTKLCFGVITYEE